MRRIDWRTVVAAGLSTALFAATSYGADGVGSTTANASTATVTSSSPTATTHPPAPIVITTPSRPGLLTRGTIEAMTGDRIQLRDENRDTAEYRLTAQTRFVGINRADLTKGAEISIDYGPDDFTVNSVNSIGAQQP
jgi:hypothetical protein